MPEDVCNHTGVTHYYSNEDPDFGRYTLSLEESGIDREKFNLFFFSEVDDTFKIYINGVIFKTITINTLVSRVDGVLTETVKGLEIGFPEGSEKFTLKIESNKYGCFETEARKNHPVLYLKYWNASWYLDHSNVFQIPAKYFLKLPIDNRL